MKSRIFFGCSLLLFCILGIAVLAGCAVRDGGYTLVSTDAEVRPDFAEQIIVTDRSYIEVTTEATTAHTEPPEVVVTGTSAPAVTTKPPVTEAPKEYYTVKFVDSDGYTMVSLQTVIEGGSATAPTMPAKRGELYFRGWNRDFTNVQRSMIVTAIYEKEIFTVRFIDIDGTLLKTEQVHWGEDAEAPEVADREGYLFNGWNTLFNSVHTDLDVYATYYLLPQRDKLTLIKAYDYLPHTDNAFGWADEVYYRRTHNAVLTVGNTEYAGDRVLYGNFCDTFALEGYDFDGIEGRLVLIGRGDADEKEDYTLRLTLYGDGAELYQTTLTRTGTNTRFDVDLTNVSELTIVLEPMIDGYVYYDYDEPVFVGGILDGAFYKEN